MTKRLNVYLCDLTHDTVLLTSDTIPLNIGFLSTYARSELGSDVNIRLFKYPNDALDALRHCPADVIALSNYSWNSRLSEHVAHVAKQYNPDVLTIQGGPNFPSVRETSTPPPSTLPKLEIVRSHRGSPPAPPRSGDLTALAFMMARPATDIFIEFEAEAVFRALLVRRLSAASSRAMWNDAPRIPGCIYIVPDTRASENPMLLRGEHPGRLKGLDAIPSPYLDGTLDQFFDGRLVPLVETNRGCPFACTFCHTGHDFYNKVRMFSVDRVIEEMKYIAPKVAALGITHLYLADTNFGMFERDQELADILAQTQRQYRWPQHVYATTGKNNKERVLKTTEALGRSLSIHMSVQSMDETVLHNIERSNIKLDAYAGINERLRKRGQITRGEIILGLPGETKGTFTAGVQKLLESGIGILTSYSLILLHGTRFKEPEYVERFGIKGRFRLVPLNFGEYAGKRIFDVEEVAVTTTDLTYDEYLWCRGLSFLVELIHNSQPFREFMRYLEDWGIGPAQSILGCYERLAFAPAAVRGVFDDFLRETADELWETEQDLIDHYSEPAHYEMLLNGHAGGNVINKYKAIGLAGSLAEWTDFFRDVCVQLIRAKLGSNGSRAPDSHSIERELECIAQFTRARVGGCLNPEAKLADLQLELSHDVISWLQSNVGTPLHRFASDPSRVRMYYSTETLGVRRDMFKRYGTSVDGLSKIVTRVSSIETMFRCVAPETST